MSLPSDLVPYESVEGSYMFRLTYGGTNFEAYTAANPEYRYATWT